MDGGAWPYCGKPFKSGLLDYSSPLPYSVVLPIELTQVDGAGNCDGTYGATGGLTNLTSPEYRENGLQTTEDTADRILAVRRA